MRRACPVVLAAVALWPAVAAAQSLGDCRDLRHHGRLEDARRCFARAALSTDPYLRAEGLWGAGEFRAANEAFRAAVERNPKNPDYRVRWGRMYLERYQPGDAAKLFEEALEIRKEYPDALLGLARVAAESFEARAVQLAEKALAADSKLVAARELLARLALEEGNTAKAIEEADKALAMSAESLEAMALRATIDWLDEKPVTAWWDRIVKINPVYGEAYAIAARFFVLNRRYEEAIRFYQKAVELNPRLWEARSLLGLNLMRLGRDQEARRQLELCYDNGYQSDATVNSLRLLDSYQNFAFVKTAAGVLKLHQKEAAVLEPYFASELARAVATFERKYRMKLEQPVRVEVYPDHEDFAVRTLGMPGLGALGVSFGGVVAMDSPSGRRPGQYHWASTLWHELSHVFVLTATLHHVPRWFTEGLAVYEETAVAPDWGDRLSPDVILAIREKKLLPVVELDRGFVRPSYPAQVPVSYFQAGRICAYIAQKWGYDKLLAMVQAYAQRMSTKDAIQQVLGVPPAELDRQFLAWLEAETRTTVAGFEDWRKRIRALNEAAQAGRHDAVTRDGPAVRDLYPEYVEAGSAYELLAEAHLAQGNKAAAAAELGRYAAAGGREPVLIKKLAALLEELGRAKDAAQAWNRLNWVYPHDEEVHRKLGDLLLAEGDVSGAIRELRTVIALKPQDPAAAHFNLARAYRQASRLEDARDEILVALEAAPGYRPAQKLLLELAEGGTVTRGGRAKE